MITMRIRVILTMLLLTLSAAASFPLMPAVMGQTTTTLTNVGPMTFTDLENNGHDTGYSIYLPPNWVLDQNTEDRVRGIVLQYEEPSTLCTSAIPIEEITTPTLSPSGKEYYCTQNWGGIGGLQDISIRMYRLIGSDNPLELHMIILGDTYDTSTTIMGRQRILNITDTTVDYVDSTTNQTIQQLPAKIANIDFSYQHIGSVGTIDLVNRVLYVSIPDTGYSYVVSTELDSLSHYTQPEKLTLDLAALERAANEIFGSFRVISK